MLIALLERWLHLHDSNQQPMLRCNGPVGNGFVTRDSKKWLHIMRILWIYVLMFPLQNIDRYISGLIDPVLECTRS